MTTTKTPYAFRLSKQAVASLIELHAATGMNQTAIVEYALAKMRAGLKGTKMERSLVFNQHGKQIDFDAAVNLMDDDLREKIRAELAPCSRTDQEFFNAYAKVHLEKFGEEFEPNNEHKVN